MCSKCAVWPKARNCYIVAIANGKAIEAYQSLYNYGIYIPVNQNKVLPAEAEVNFGIVLNILGNHNSVGAQVCLVVGYHPNRKVVGLIHKFLKLEIGEEVECITRCQSVIGIKKGFNRPV